ncbi:hypothetical protein DC852_01765 [Vibrio parahaemolyticus]|nr:hypothetical protein [Vibrio parahaemolyticus]EGQ8939107.1 hypothetical protein [Vibrio parahaemolyticus]EGQ8948020.1 hypothetical protein [Vibrio parahaemolyticus]EGQ8968604.1 hypothetical protein [Vibrio parahaemolyticus]EGR2710446.1 hypothetical protein [Vibrio parahaemolyticus]
MVKQNIKKTPSILLGVFVSEKPVLLFSDRLAVFLPFGVRMNEL